MGSSGARLWTVKCFVIRCRRGLRLAGIIGQVNSVNVYILFGVFFDMVYVWIFEWNVCITIFDCKNKVSRVSLSRPQLLTLEYGFSSIAPYSLFVFSRFFLLLSPPRLPLPPPVGTVPCNLTLFRRTWVTPALFYCPALCFMPLWPPPARSLAAHRLPPSTALLLHPAKPRERERKKMSTLCILVVVLSIVVRMCVRL